MFRMQRVEALLTPRDTHLLLTIHLSTTDLYQISIADSTTIRLKIPPDLAIL